ncbi:MAG TPA: ABC transporter permease [Iamia sp.]|nr:ABC transporter permease [Iamia sp.]
MATVVIVDDPIRLGHRSWLSKVRGRGWWGWVAVLVLIGAFAVAGGLISPYDHTQQVPREKFLSPLESGSRGLHVFGTDELGRDVLSQVIAGARLTLFIAMAATLIGASIGCLLGMLAGYLGGWVDRVVMRLTEAQTAMPMFLVALLLLSSLGPSVWNLIAILPTYIWPTFARLIRGETLRMRSAAFVEAAVTIGCRTRTVLARHLLPNLASRVGVLLAISTGQVILSEAGLSFIGAGVQDPDVTWGLLISGGRTYLTVAWWPTVFPGLFAGLTVFALNGLARRFTETGAR